MRTILTGILLCAITALGAPIQQQHAVVAKRMAAPAGFAYSSVIFDGANDYLTRGGTPVPDGTTGLLSVWIKMGASSNDTALYWLMLGDGYFYIRRATGTTLQVVTGPNGPNVMTSDIAVNKAGGWYHIMASWDTASSTSARMYINGVNHLNSITLTSGTIDYAGTDWRIGAHVSSGADKWDGLVCELYFTDEYLDLSVAGNRDKFFNSGTSKPVDLGATGSTPTGTQPRIYQRNGFATWHTNLGSGGNFTVTGALGDGGVDKP